MPLGADNYGYSAESRPRTPASRGQDSGLTGLRAAAPRRSFVEAGIRADLDMDSTYGVGGVYGSRPTKDAQMLQIVQPAGEGALS